MKRSLKFKISKKLLISSALLLFLFCSVLTVLYNTTFKELGKKQLRANNPTINSMLGGNSANLVTLLTGNSSLAADTWEDTIDNYRKTYLFGEAADYSVFLQGNFIPTDSDIEGRAAIGGNIDIKTTWAYPWTPTYTIGAGDYWKRDSLDELIPDRIGSATIIIGGKLIGNLTDTYYENNIKYESIYSTDSQGNPAKTPEHKSTKKLVLNYTSLPTDYQSGYNLATNIPTFSNGEYQKVDQTQTYVAKVLDFESSFSHLNTVNGKIAKIEAGKQNTISYDGDYKGNKGITFTYEGDPDEPREAVYFYLSAEDYALFQEANIIEFENIPPVIEAYTDWEYAYIIVNVEAEGTAYISSSNTHNGSKFTYINGEPISYDLKKSNVSATGSDNNMPGTDTILYNFVGANKMVLGGNLQGTILAPGAEITDMVMTEEATQHGHISGALVAQSFEGATEFGWRPFMAPIDVLPGSLKVTKTVNEKNYLDIDKEFNFTVTLEASLNGKYGEMEFENGVAHFTLKHGESKTATDLPALINYTVTEDTEGKYKFESKNDTGKIAGDTEIEVTFENTQLVGDLTVSKTIESDKITDDKIDTNKSFEFTVEIEPKLTGTFGNMTFTNGVAQFELKHGESKTATNLPKDVSYKVTETADERYDVEPTNATGTIVEGQTKTANFINKPVLGNLKVSKTIESDKITADKIDTNKSFTFTVRLNEELTGTYGDMTFTKGETTFTLKHGESKEATNLPVGIGYTVTEADDSRYDVHSSNEKGNIKRDETINVEFFNIPLLGDLVVSKVIDGNKKDTNKSFTFTVKLNEDLTGTYGEMEFNNGEATFTLKHGESKRADNLPVGIGYTVTEAEDERYDVEPTNSTGTIVEGQTITAKFTNKPVLGNLEVKKTIQGRIDYEKDFTFKVKLNENLTGIYGEMEFNNGEATFTLKHGESKVARELPINIQYTVTEVEDERYDIEPTNDTGKISRDTTEVAEFINIPLLGNLTVSKTIESDKIDDDKIDTNKSFTFTVKLDEELTGTYGDMTFINGETTFELKHGESKTARELPKNIGYTVTEEKDDRYAIRSSNEKGEIVQNQTITSSFINIPLLGDLTVSKNIEANKIDTEKSFKFTVKLNESLTGTYGEMEFKNGVATFELKHGESKTAQNLPKNTQYTVTEAKDDRYEIKSTNAEGTIVEDKTITAEFVNVALVGSLKVTKQVKGEEEDREKDFHFIVELDEPLTGRYGDMDFVDGVAEFDLKDGESKEATDLPDGIGYTVTEEKDSDRYDTSITKERGTISQEETADVKSISVIPSSPNTFDGILLWVTLCIMSLCSIVVATLTKKRLYNKI